MAGPRGAAVQDLAVRLNRAAEEEVASGGRAAGGAGSLDVAALQRTITAAVQAAIASRLPARGEGEGGETAPATAQQLEAVVAELHTMITTLASPAPHATVVVKKTKRYELGQSTSHEKACPVCLCLATTCTSLGHHDPRSRRRADRRAARR